MLTHAAEMPVYSRWPFRPVRGAGCTLWNAAGESVLDMYAGHAVALSGHCHPRVVEAIKAQAERLLFYSNALPLDARDSFLSALTRVGPAGLDQIFLVNSGAEANEQAIALARRATGRGNVVAFDGGFHGRTLATLALSGIDRYRKIAAVSDAGRGLLEKTRWCSFGDAAGAEELIDQTVAAVIVEPVQGLAGARSAGRDFFVRLMAACRQHGAYLIFDEVQSGSGRCGAFTTAQALGVTPHAITLAKGIAAGLPLGAVLVSEELAEGIGGGDLGTTFGGGPIPCAAGAANLAVLVEDGLCQNALARERQLRAGLTGMPHVVEVCGRGLLLGVRLDIPAQPVMRAMFEKKVLTGSAVDPHVLRLLPPLVLDSQEVEQFLAALGDLLVRMN